MRSGPAPIAGLLLGLALILTGCGGDEAATAGRETAQISADAARSKAKPNDSRPATSQSASKRCGRQLGDFLDSIESLGNSLAVGLSYDDYLSAVNHVRATYASVEADRLSLGCLGRVAGPSEQSLNTYIEATNAWGDCLATPGCSLNRSNRGCSACGAGPPASSRRPRARFGA